MVSSRVGAGAVNVGEGSSGVHAACGIYRMWIYLSWILLPAPIPEYDMTERDDGRELPLNPPVFHILLALSERDLHGLGIADEVERATEGAVELGPGTLYRSLKEMSAGGLIRETEAPVDDADPRRKYYRITSEGRALVTAEAARLERLVRVARERNLLPERA